MQNRSTLTSGLRLFTQELLLTFLSVWQLFSRNIYLEYKRTCGSITCDALYQIKNTISSENFRYFLCEMSDITFEDISETSFNFWLNHRLWTPYIKEVQFMDNTHKHFWHSVCFYWNRHNKYQNRAISVPQTWNFLGPVVFLPFAEHTAAAVMDVCCICCFLSEKIHSWLIPLFTQHVHVTNPPRKQSV